MYFAFTTQRSCPLVVLWEMADNMIFILKNRYIIKFCPPNHL